MSEDAGFGERGFASDGLGVYFGTGFDKEFEDLDAAYCCGVVEGGAADGVSEFEVGVVVECGFDEVGGGDGGGEHEEGLGGGGEGGVEEGVYLVEEGDGGLRGAFGHLHALVPDLDGRGST